MLLRVEQRPGLHGPEVTVYYKNRPVFSWDDGVHHPDDLVWSRKIRDVFHAGVEVGRLMEREKESSA